MPPSQPELHAVHDGVDDARSWMSRICGPHQLESRRTGKLHFVHEAVRLPGLSTVLGQIRYGTDVTIGVERSIQLDAYSLSLPLERSEERRVGKECRSR